MVEHLVGMQAQVPRDPYVGLWARLDGFQPGDLVFEIEGRRAVRLHMLRCTIHLFTARDALKLRPLLQPVMERAFYRSSPFGRQVAGVDVEALLEAGREFVEKRPRATSELAKHLAQRWPKYDAPSLAYAVNYLVPTVQVTPRGLWERSSRPAWTTLSGWTGKPLEAGASLEDLVLRYLAAFGPASVADMQMWSGFTGLREIFERLRPRLRIFGDERRREVFDLPDAPLPDADTPAPPRFLPEYDNAFLAHADRSRMADVDARQRFMRAVGVGPLLVDGFVVGCWRIRRQAGTATLFVQAFGTLSSEARAEVELEAGRLLAFLAPVTERRELRFGDFI